MMLRVSVPRCARTPAIAEIILECHTELCAGLGETEEAIAAVPPPVAACSGADLPPRDLEYNLNIGTFNARHPSQGNAVRFPFRKSHGLIKSSMVLWSASSASGAIIGSIKVTT
jgi:hypothetical protein